MYYGDMYYGDVVLPALESAFATGAYVEQTGGNCEAIILGPFEGAGDMRYLMITDGDAGLPGGPDCERCEQDGRPCACRVWLLACCPHHPCGDECDLCGDCCSQEYVSSAHEPLTPQLLITTITRALMGERDSAVPDTFAYRCSSCGHLSDL